MKGVKSAAKEANKAQKKSRRTSRKMKEEIAKLHLKLGEMAQKILDDENSSKEEKKKAMKKYSEVLKSATEEGLSRIEEAEEDYRHLKASLKELGREHKKIMETGYQKGLGPSLPKFKPK